MTRHIRVEVAGHSLDIIGDEAVGRCRPAFSRVEVSPAGPADAVLHLETLADPCRSAGPLQVGLNRSADGSFAVLRTAPPMLEGFRPAHASGTGAPRLEVIASPEALAAGDVLAQPGHVAIAAWLAARGSFLMHAAGVAIDGRGLLLIGAGGRGKTTTALAAARHGFDFLGDDLCIVSPNASGQSGHLLHGLYATAKLNPDSRERLGLAAWPVLGATPKGKVVTQLPPEIGFARSVPLAAIVHVGPSRHAGPRMTRLPPREALRQLGTASGPMLTVSRPSGAWLGAMAALARDVPVVSLALDWNLDDVVDSLATIATSAEAGRRGEAAGLVSAIASADVAAQGPAAV
jgi:hypothetical protein